MGIAELVGHSRRVVVIAPHPDDETLGCGGMLAEAALAGLETEIIVVTDGENSNPGDSHWSPQALARARRDECRRAADDLGVPLVRYLGFEDGTLASQEERLVERLSDAIKAGDMLFAPWRHDGHPDHDATGRAACRVADERNLELREYTVWAWLDAARDTAFAALERSELMLSPAAQSAKRRAIQRFETQLGTSNPPVAQPVLSAAVVPRWTGASEIFTP